MIIVTTVEEYKSEVFKLFKKAGVESFSGSDIDGYKKAAPLMYTAAEPAQPAPGASFPSTASGSPVARWCSTWKLTTQSRSL